MPRRARFCPAGFPVHVIQRGLDIEVLSKIRHCANTGLVLGTESFRAQVQKLRNQPSRTNFTLSLYSDPITFPRDR